MSLNKFLILPFLVLAFNFAPVNNSHAGQNVFYPTLVTDSPSFESLVDFFDLRDRETFIQLTYFEVAVQGISANMHIQIFDVSNNCNENNFFDVYTTNDTHTYNMRDIQTNDGNPSGVVLPDGAYGIVAVTFSPVILAQTFVGLLGNIRILDDNGYEYRTNATAVQSGSSTSEPEPDNFYTFNFNQENGVILSDIVGVTVDAVFGESPSVEFIANPLNVFNSYDVDIYDNNEVPFSCRDVIFACVNQQSSLLEPLLEFAGTANVASFEYGINNAIPHSKGGELLCPGNNIGEGVVVLRPELQPVVSEVFPFTAIFIGLNNGNGRGSLDTIWQFFEIII